jgi:hypothetical protein
MDLRRCSAAVAASYFALEDGRYFPAAWIVKQSFYFSSMTLGGEIEIRVTEAAGEGLLKVRLLDMMTKIDHLCPISSTVGTHSYSRAL